MTVAPLIYSALAAAGLITRRSATLKMPRVYLWFTVLTGLAGPVLLRYSSPAVYTKAFLLVEFTGNILLCAMALEIVAYLAPPRFAQAWGIGFLALLVIICARQLPHLGNVAGWLNLTVSEDFIAGILLVGLVLLSDVHWTQETVLTAAGIAVMLLADALPLIQVLQGGRAMRTVLQFGPLVGLLLVAVAGWRNQEMFYAKFWKRNIGRVADRAA